MAVPLTTNTDLVEPRVARETPNGRHYWPLRARSLGVLVAGYVVLTAVWTLLGLLVVEVLGSSFVGEAETELATWLESHRTAGLDSVSHYGSMLSDTFTKLTLVPLLGAVFVIAWRRWHDAVFLAAALLLEVSVFATAAFFVGRDRPPVEQLDGSLPTNSFPSGHVAAAVAFYAGLLVIARWHTRRAAVIAPVACLAVIAPLVVATSRLYRGMHYLSDVLAGAALGAVSLAVTYFALQTGLKFLRDRHGDALPRNVASLDLTQDLTRVRDQERDLTRGERS